jgi:tRNA (guanine-N7-)-methyltransferase
MVAGSPHGRLDWHGRRHGRRLRARRRDLLTNLLPDLRPALPPPGRLLDLAGLFPHRPRDIWLEIGFGNGEHLAELAHRHADVGFLGCEVYVNGVAALLGHVDRLGLQNVRIFDEDARLLLAALPAASLSRAFLLFPDPWPKKRHAKRRFIGAASLAALARALAVGGDFRIATDDPDYVAWTLQHLVGHLAFRWCASRPRDWREPPKDWVATRYQKKAELAGRRIVFLCFERSACAAGPERPCDLPDVPYIGATIDRSIAE